jgi:dipeptidyl aminopeptidase/acylaminoacyl peptidase
MYSRYYREVQSWFTRVEAPGFGSVTGGMELHGHPSGVRLAFAGTIRNELAGTANTVLCVADKDGLHVVGHGPHDRMPRWSPDGRWLASIGQGASGRPQLQLRSAESVTECLDVPEVEGIVESIDWSPSGARLLLVVADEGADLAGGQGSGNYGDTSRVGPSWSPTVRSWPARSTWRRCLMLRLDDESLTQVSPAGVTVWEASWAGEECIAAVVSDEPGEGAWYSASLDAFDLTSGRSVSLLRSDIQIGVPVGSPDGRHVAVVEAVCSDRQVVAGDILLMDRQSGALRRLDSSGVDVTGMVWRTDTMLFYIGVRGLDVVAGEIDIGSGSMLELWSTPESCGVRLPEAWPTPDGRILALLESYDRPVRLVEVVGSVVRDIATLAHGGSEEMTRTGGQLERVSWGAPDGLEIQGLLVRPAGIGPHPLVVNIHGGPVWSWRNRWAMANGGRPALVPLLAAAGYAVLHPNPRGSSGRGQTFAAAVRGDMGGADTFDFTSGVDHLVKRGDVDPSRVGLTGISYGGYMSSWLVTQDPRFAAAVAVSPTTDWVSQHYTSNIGVFDELFLGSTVGNRDGNHVRRSPVTLAHQVRTPVLHVAGALDRCTPPGQAQEFHQALSDNGVRSELVIYPEEGHGVSGFPAAIDFTARMLAWFAEFMPAGAAL